MYQKILVPIDGSETSMLGLKEAIKLAKRESGHLRLLHVVNEYILDGAYSAEVYASTLIASLRECGQKIVRDAESLVREQGLPTDSVLIESIGGPAADSIIAQAKEWPADLIVMGTHGRRGLRRFAMGSDAENVVRGAPVPVLLVRDLAKETEGSVRGREAHSEEPNRYVYA
jgi:nucleotide-binding universal stress UspA family protein